MTSRLCTATITLALTALSLPVIAQPLNTVSVSGDALIHVTPDEVIVNLGVETFAPELASAKAQNDALSQSLVAAIRRLGVEPGHIHTADVEVEIRYRERTPPPLTIEGFFARRAYAVTLKDITLFERLVDTAIANGANRLMGFEYRTTDLRAHRDEARRMAMRAAREKAELMTGELGATLGGPRSISEGHLSYIGYTNSRWDAPNWMASQNTVQREPIEPGGDTMPLGRIGIRAAVNVVFEIAN